MKTKKRISEQLPVSHLLLLLLLLLLMSFVSSCSSHQENASTQSEPQILDEQGLTKEANDRFWSAVKPVSNLPLSHYRLGRYYQKGNKHELAINEFTKAVTLNKEYVQAYNALGMSYDHLLNCEGAEWAYSQALQYGAGKAYVYNNFGCSRLICDKNDQAIALFSKAQEIDGSNTRIRNNLRLAEIRGGYQKGDGFSSLPEEPLASAVENSGYVEAPKPGMKETEPVIGADKGAPFVETVLVAEKKVKPEMADKPIAIKTKSPKLQVAASGDISKPASCGVEISNGNGVTGMAKKGAAYLRKLGFSVKRITNAPQFTVQDTKIYYRDGCLALAESVAKVIPGSQEFERVNDLGRAGVGVRLTLGGDMVNIRFPEGLERHFAKK